MVTATIQQAELRLEGYLWAFFLFSTAGKDIVYGPRLDQWNKVAMQEEPHAFAGAMLTAVMRTLGCTEWNQLWQMPCRLALDEGRHVLAIGHPVLDRWYVPAELLKRFET